MIRKKFLNALFGIRFKGFSNSVIISFPHDMYRIIREIPNLHFKSIIIDFMKDKFHLNNLNSIEQIGHEHFINLSGSVSPDDPSYTHLKSRHLSDEGSLIINLKQGTISNQFGLCKLLGYCESNISLTDLESLCHSDQIMLVKHIIATYINYNESKHSAQDTASLSLTFKAKKRNGTYIKVFCQISVYESHENRLTKLLIKFTNINFISTGCDMAWTLQSNSEQQILFKNLIAQKFKAQFSEREIEIVRQMQFSLNNAEIGDKLFISKHTVATHRKHLYKKSNLHSAASLIAHCRERGLL